MAWMERRLSVRLQKMPRGSGGKAIVMGRRMLPQAPTDRPAIFRDRMGHVLVASFGTCRKLTTLGRAFVAQET